MITKSLTDRWIPLSELGLHQTAQVMELDGDEACRHRVEEMGLRPGSAIQMLRCDSPHIIAIDGRRVSFRFSDCVQVWVKPYLNYAMVHSEER
jgi:Fe2+ transport system protein FeoA